MTTSRSAPGAEFPATVRTMRIAGSLAVVFGVLLFVPVIVLGVAIGWPTSLSEPAEVIIPLINEQDMAVTLGYLVYLVYSVLFFPVIVSLSRVLGDRPITRAATVLAAVSALARSIGIIRWLSVLPMLAAAYVASPNDAIPVIFDAINSWGGAIGELMGVSAFAAMSLALISAAIVRSPVLPTWIGVSGFVVVAGLLLPWIEVFGVDLGAIISVSTSLMQLWFLTLGVVLFVTAARRRTASASASTGSVR